MNQTNAETYTLYTYSTTLEFNAIINIEVRSFNATTPINFAGNNTIFSPYTIKINVIIQNWPFFTLSNSLAIFFLANASNNDNNCEGAFENTNRDVKWISITVGNTTLYAQFDNKAIVDGRVRTITYSLNKTDYSVAAILPHFWNYAEMDPQYGVLLQDTISQKECKNNKRGWLFIIEIAVPSIVVVILLVVFIIVGSTRLRTYLRVRKSFTEIAMQSRSNSIGQQNS